MHSPIEAIRAIKRVTLLRVENETTVVMTSEQPPCNTIDFARYESRETDEILINFGDDLLAELKQAVDDAVEDKSQSVINADKSPSFPHQWKSDGPYFSAVHQLGVLEYRGPVYPGRRDESSSSCST